MIDPFMEEFEYDLIESAWNFYDPYTEEFEESTEVDLLQAHLLYIDPDV